MLEKKPSANESEKKVTHVVSPLQSMTIGVNDYPTGLTALAGGKYEKKVGNENQNQ